MMTMLKLAAFAATLLASSTAHAAFFATTLVSQTNTTAFGTGLVTGAPDGGGRFLGSSFDPPAALGEIVVMFSTALTNGAGADLKVYDVASSASETFEVFVSSDNVTYTSLGGFSATLNLIDFGAFAGPVSYVKLANTSRLVSVDIDAVEGFYAAPISGAVPEPSTWAMMLFGFGLVGRALRRRRILTGAVRVAI
jgi:hypothetical protein